MPAKTVQDLSKYIDLLRVHHPEMTGAVAYLQDWMRGGHGRRLTPLRELRFLRRELSEAQGAQIPSAPLALHHTHPVKLISVNRERKRQRTAASLPEVESFEAYLAKRESQGASRSDAQAEWNGLALLRIAAQSC